MSTTKRPAKHTPAKRYPPKPTVIPVQPEFETLRSAGERTAVSLDFLRGLIASGELPAYRVTDKPGAMLRVRIADVDALMKPYIPPEAYPAAAGRAGGSGR